MSYTVHQYRPHNRPWGALHCDACSGRHELHIVPPVDDIEARIIGRVHGWSVTDLGDLCPDCTDRAAAAAPRPQPVIPVAVLDDDLDLWPIIARQLGAALERRYEPWLYPDPPAIAWTFDPFPRLTRLAHHLRRSA